MKNACWICLVLVIGLLGGGSTVRASNPEIDALKRQIAQTPDSLQSALLDQLADQFELIGRLDSFYVYSEQAYQRAVAYHDTVPLVQALYNFSTYYRQVGDTSKADSFLYETYRVRGTYGYELNKTFPDFNNSIYSNGLRLSLMLYVDTTQSVEWPEVIGLDQAGKFGPNLPDRFDEDARAWLKFRIKGHPDTAEKAIFMVGAENITWDTIRVYIPQGDSSYRQELTGNLVYDRDKNGVSNWRSLFQVDLAANEEITVFIQLDGASVARRPDGYIVHHLKPNFLTEILPTRERNTAVFLGILVAQFLYFLLFSLVTRERTYAPYLVYVLGVILFALTDFTYHDWLQLWPEYDWFVYFIALGVAGYGLISFAMNYLNIKELSPLWYRIAQVFRVVYSIPPAYMASMFVLSTMFDQREGVGILVYVAVFMVSSLFFLVTLGLILVTWLGILAYRKQFKPASSYLVGMVILILMVGITPSLIMLVPEWVIGVVSYQGAILMAQAGVVLQLIFFAMGVGQKVNTLEKGHADALAEKLQAEQRANDKLRRADQLKDEFLANTSHELRTPLNGILGLTEAVHDGVAGPTTPEMRENLGMVMNSARRLSGLVNDILDFSKLQNADLELQLKPIDFRSLAYVVMKVSESMLAGKPLALTLDIPAGLPPVLADENRLQQILYNLIGNAIKFTPQGHVILRAEAIGERLHMSVADTGIGIPADQLETIFESFQQGDGSTAREYGGTGLGLTITRQLVELHRGQLSVQSEVGKGSVFTFDLPTTQAAPQPLDQLEVSQARTYLSSASEPPEQAAPLPQDKPAALKGSSYHILVVDDEPVNRQVLKNHLAADPYLVTTVMGGEEALQAINSGASFDLVLLDVMMPKMSGFEVCQLIREQYLPSELPVIMVTAKNQVSDLVSGLSFGANDYIVKPFSKQELLARIKTHLNLQHIHKATSRFVPYEFLRSLGKEAITEVELGDQVAREGTVMFSDIRGYSGIAENMKPAETFGFLNAYLSRMGPVIQANHGFVNQFFGDGIMSLFLAEPEDALKAAIGMMDNVNQYNHERLAKRRKPLQVGIGIHTGSLMMGMIGDAKRLDTGLVSDTVNMASRIEGLTKFYGAPILISEAVKDSLQHQEAYLFRYLGKALLKGRSGATALYECLNGLPAEVFQAKQQALPAFEQGLQAYFAREFQTAEQAFEAALAAYPADLAARHYHQKAQALSGSTVPPDWTGVE